MLLYCRWYFSVSVSLIVVVPLVLLVVLPNVELDDAALPPPGGHFRHNRGLVLANRNFNACITYNVADLGSQRSVRFSDPNPAQV